MPEYLHIIMTTLCVISAFAIGMKVGCDIGYDEGHQRGWRAGRSNWMNEMHE